MSNTIIATTHSSFIDGLAYDRDSGTMAVQIGEHAYGYQVPQDLYMAVALSPSVGTAFNSMVRGKYPAIDLGH